MSSQNQNPNTPIVCIGPARCQICFYCRKALFYFTLTFVVLLLAFLLFLSEVGVNIQIGPDRHSH